MFCGHNFRPQLVVISKLLENWKSKQYSFIMAFSVYSWYMVAVKVAYSCASLACRDTFCRRLKTHFFFASILIKLALFLDTVLCILSWYCCTVPLRLVRWRLTSVSDSLIDSRNVNICSRVTELVQKRFCSFTGLPQKLYSAYDSKYTYMVVSDALFAISIITQFNMYYDNNIIWSKQRNSLTISTDRPLAHVGDKMCPYRITVAIKRFRVISQFGFIERQHAIPSARLSARIHTNTHHPEILIRPAINFP